MKREIAKMSPEELMQLQAMLAQSQGQPMPEGMFALGGHLFKKGGSTKTEKPAELTSEDEAKLAERYLNQFTDNKQLRALLTALGVDNTNIGNTGTTEDSRLLREAFKGYKLQDLQNAFTKASKLNYLTPVTDYSDYTRIGGTSDKSTFGKFLDRMSAYK